MKIIFISHSYPPLIGGIEKQNADLFRSLSKIANVKLIANGRGKFFLPFFGPYALVKSSYYFLIKKYDACLLGSGVMAVVGVILKAIFPNKKVFSIVHGLDITYANQNGLLPFIYKTFNINALKRLNKLFAVGNHTIKEGIKVNINKEKFTFIPNGIFPEEIFHKPDRKSLISIIGEKNFGKKIILRVARFVPHKGNSWFINKVIPELPDNYLTIFVGGKTNNIINGKNEFTECENAIKNNKLEKKVLLLPNLEQKKLKILLNNVDLVISPNIKIPGMMEGFGINVIEAGACGRIVLASCLEGLADAIKNGENGFLIKPEDSNAWKEKIIEILEASNDFRTEFGNRAQKYVEEYYSWKTLANSYLKEMTESPLI